MEGRMPARGWPTVSQQRTVAYGTCAIRFMSIGLRKTEPSGTGRAAFPPCSGRSVLVALPCGEGSGAFESVVRKAAMDHHHLRHTPPASRLDRRDVRLRWFLRGVTQVQQLANSQRVRKVSHRGLGSRKVIHPRENYLPTGA